MQLTCLSCHPWMFLVTLPQFQTRNVLSINTNSGTTIFTCKVNKTSQSLLTTRSSQIARGSHSWTAQHRHDGPLLGRREPRTHTASPWVRDAFDSLPLALSWLARSQLLLLDSLRSSPSSSSCAGAAPSHFRVGIFVLPRQLLSAGEDSS
jgi:hypothetical protein